MGTGVAVKVSGVTAGGFALKSTDGEIRSDAADISIGTNTNNFKFTAARTRHKMIAASSFQTASSGDTLEFPYVYDYTSAPYLGSISDAGSYYAFAQVYVPIGATITGVSLAFNNSSGSARIPVIDLRKSSYSNDTTLLTSSSITTWSPSVPDSNTTFWYASSTISEVTADNSFYIIQVLMPVVAFTPDNFKFYGARVTYTYANVNVEHV